MKYKIADYLSHDAREAACAETYINIDGLPRVRGFTDLFCPLGIALHRMFPLETDTITGAPDSSEVAEFLATHATEADVLDAASAFILDWDTGKITNLTEAFGLDN